MQIFYLELAMDKTEFIQLEEFEVQEDESPDSILEATQQKMASNKESTKNNDIDPSDLLDELGL